MCSQSILKMRDIDVLNGNMDNSSDSDICEQSEINKTFYGVDTVCNKVIAKNKYILHIDATGDHEPLVSVALSDNTCEVYKLSNDQVTILTTFTEFKDKIIDCRFSKRDYNLIYIGSGDGNITLWDIRTPKKSVINFLDSTAENGKCKTFSCFDISSNERILSVGTELYEGDAYLLFWDLRSHELLGGYWESHTDDITQVKFHPEDRDKLLSGSTDGLINIYDISQSSEDDALIDSLNTQSSIDRLMWFRENGKDEISCITHTSDLQLWSLVDAAPYKHFSRADIAKELKMAINLQMDEVLRQIPGTDKLRNSNLFS